jgi:flagellar basal-body rod protein FlgB
MEVLARNIANADTPNYKAQDIDFKAMLQDVKTEYLNATNDKHYAGIQDAPDDGMRYRIPYNSSFDGNTVGSAWSKHSLVRPLVTIKPPCSF